MLAANAECYTHLCTLTAVTFRRRNPRTGALSCTDLGYFLAQSVTDIWYQFPLLHRFLRQFHELSNLNVFPIYAILRHENWRRFCLHRKKVAFT